MALGKNKRKKHFGRRAFFLLLAAALVFAAGYLDLRLRPAIQSLAASRANTYAVRAMSATVYRRMEEVSVKYDNLVRITYTDAGDVASLQTDIVALGVLQSDITSNLASEIASLSTQSVSIPLGNILGNQWFSGKGPNVTFRLIPANSLQTTVLNSFDEAGINQTRHQILLNVKLNLDAIAPGYRAHTEVDTNYVLAETIIVGLVPEAYTRVYNTEEDSVPGMLNDYGADNYLSGG